MFQEKRRSSQNRGHVFKSRNESNGNTRSFTYRAGIQPFQDMKQSTNMGL